ncbi:MAG: energy transducer TonB [Bacteroides sp.]|nr:energy transducer TonB [Roseburia sp.]MCM1347552.1 energy transducer TonB [Bacteroides sp.]MCM1420604.1 energy transducer TonB [Bacteroides sp.]
MDKIILLTVLFAIHLSAKAQFFGFGFGEEPFTHRMEQHEKEPFTAPVFKGGNEALNRFIEKNFKNPSPRSDVYGSIIIACIINEKGKVVDTQIIRHADDALDAEAVRTAKKLKFKPGRQGKKKVKSRYDVAFPIKNGRLSFSTLETIEV